MSGEALAAPYVGCTFRGYRIDQLIASGGMGAVYLARDESLPNVRKVIKVLLADSSLSEATRAFVHERFTREALTVSVLDHENIVKVHAVGMLDGTSQPCMLMDYAEGQTLHDYTRTYGGRVPPYRVLPLMCHVARGLDAAHALGIVHRDLKPANVMLCPKDNDPAFCMLLDFGTAKLTKPIVGGLVPTMGGMGIGTPSYMAVEQFKHADEATPLSDVYALAIMIWEMVTGELPWGRHDTSTPVGIAMLYQLQRDSAPHAPPEGTLPPSWERTLRSALSPSSDLRPASVRHLLVDLAVGLEPVGPHVRSGVEILRTIAPRFIAESEPDADTVRDTPRRTIVVAWPRSELPVRVATTDIPTRRELPSRGPKTPALRVGSQGAAPAVTTLGASNGVLLRDSVRPTRRKLVYLAVAAAAVAAVVAIGVLSGSGRDAIVRELPRAIPATQATPRVPRPAESPITNAPNAAVQPATTPLPASPPPPPPPPPQEPIDVQPAAVASPETASAAAKPPLNAPRSQDAGAVRSTSTTKPVKTGRPASPDRTKAYAPDPRSGRKFDPDAVGGQDEE
jgi:serine/threonine protein kinase